MLGWWSEDPRVPEYINRLEDAQKKSSRAGLPITDAWLAAIATMSLLAASSFPKLRHEWDGLAPTSKTWTAWKKWALHSQKTVEREQKAAGNRGDSFGSASAAIATHGIPMTRPVHFSGATAATQLPSLAELESHLDNMAAAVTNEKAVLDSLVASNATLTSVTADKLAKIEKHLLDIKAGRTTQAGSHTAPQASDSRVLGQLRAAIKHKWTPGGFCSTHGWGVGAGHTSAECKKKQPGHVDSATRANPQGPGATRNKGWDDFLSAST
jgi:hypothetical protein